MELKKNIVDEIKREIMETNSSVYKLIKAKAATYNIPPKNISRWLKFS
jgi:hypothetical protein